MIVSCSLVYEGLDFRTLSYDSGLPGVRNVLDGQFIPFNRWCKKMGELQKSKSIIFSGATILSIKMFGPRVGFLTLDANISDPVSRVKLPGFAFLRGDSVAVLVVFTVNEVPYSILTGFNFFILQY